MSRFPVVLFDLDGTVIDSGAVILASMRHATREVLGIEPSDAELLAGVGVPLEAQMAAFAPERVDELARVYRAHNIPLLDRVEACDGIEDVILRLHDNGARLGVVTSKLRETAELAFAKLRVSHLFEVLVGGNETGRHKPDPEPLLLAARRLGVAPMDCAYIGDAPFDIRAAKAAHMYSVAVTWGRIHDRPTLEAEDPAAVADTPEELYACL